MSDDLTDHNCRSRVHSESKVLKSMHEILMTSKHDWRHRIWFVCQTLTVRVMGLWAFLVRLLRLVKVSFFNWAIWGNSLHPTVNRFRVRVSLTWSWTECWAFCNRSEAIKQLLIKTNCYLGIGHYKTLTFTSRNEIEGIEFELNSIVN